MEKCILELKEITKNYKAAGVDIPALRGIDIAFRKNEFVSILGPSGCGKTTMLNIIGGLDKYTSGDLIIKGQSTKNFSASDWDTYRNHSIGFVFQNYNLIQHLSVLQNVELALTLAGVKNKVRKEKALSVLERVGLKNEHKKKPNQLSGGQMQRVAIARALVNDPEILLADEPTGALDSETSVQIMELIKEISKERLVIMVTHNKELADRYSTRIITLLDGEKTGDSNPPQDNLEVEQTEEKIENFDEKAQKSLKKRKKTAIFGKKSSMSLFTAFMLSLKNLFSKKTRTALVSFAGSIGIIGVALVLAISNGFTNYINRMQTDTLGGYPIAVSTVAIDYDSLIDNMSAATESSDKVYENEIGVYNPIEMVTKMGTYNFISPKFLQHLNTFIENDNKKQHKSLSSYQFSYATNLKVLAEGKYGTFEVKTTTSTSTIYGTTSSLFYEGLEDTEFVLSNYEIVSGNYPQNKNEVLLVLDSSGAMTTTMLDGLGISYTRTEGVYDPIDYSSIVGVKTFKLLSNDEYYTPIIDGEGNVTQFQALKQEELQSAYDLASTTLTVCGIMKPKEDIVVEVFETGIMYLPELARDYAQDCKLSAIALETTKQNKFFIPYTMDISEMSGLGMPVPKLNTPQELVDYVKSQFNVEMSQAQALDVGLQMVGASSTPVGVFLYPKDFDAKQEILDVIDDWNNSEDGKFNKIVYTDATEVLTSTLGQLVNIISYVLVAFASISLIVSSIMIGIITYVSVVERTKEIGVLRSVGARKRDIARVFNAETFIIGFLSGAIGIALTYILCLPLNAIIVKLAGISGLAQFKFTHALILIGISVILTLISGLIPARIASKKDPVNALRSE